MDSDNNECTKSICKDEIGPVCGSDGITYRFDEKDCTYPIPPGVEVDYTGECCLDKCSQLDFNPVCDDSNVTYLVSLFLCIFDVVYSFSRTFANLEKKDAWQ